MSIAASDEHLHTPGPGASWQESYYFNWSDPTHEVFGLTRIGLRPHTRRGDAIVLTIRRGKPEFLYPGVGLRIEPWSSLDPARGLRCGALTFTMEEPLRRYRLTLSGRHSMDLCFEACNPAFDYHTVGAHTAAGFDSPMAAHHFEQFGRVRGRTSFHGTTLEINGHGERDKSWGERDWGRIEGWNWLTAQFGDDLAFNVLGVFDGARRHVGGFVFRDGSNHAVRDYSVEWRWDGREHVPAGATLRLEDVDGGVLDVVAEGRGRFPLYRGRTWIEEVKATFRAEIQGRSRTGHGVLEHAWRPSLATSVRYAHEIARGLSRAITP